MTYPIAEFDASEYVTARGHLCQVGDFVLVMTPNNVLRDGRIERLLPRHVGDTPDVMVRDVMDTRRTLVTNAFCVEPDTLYTRHRRAS